MKMKIGNCFCSGGGGSSSSSISSNIDSVAASTSTSSSRRSSLTRAKRVRVPCAEVDGGRLDAPPTAPT